MSLNRALLDNAMPRKPSKTTLSNYFETLRLALENERYRDTLELAINAYRASVDIKDKALETLSLTYIVKAAQCILVVERKKSAEFARMQHKCAFCGRSQNGRRVIAGADANICEDCAKRIHDFFTKN